MTSDQRGVVVTGVSTGIGWEAAKTLCQKGFRVYGSAHKEEDAARTQKDSGDTLTPLGLDVRDDKAIQLAAAQVRRDLADRTLFGYINNSATAFGAAAHSCGQMAATTFGAAVNSYYTPAATALGAAVNSYYTPAATALGTAAKSYSTPAATAVGAASKSYGYTAAAVANSYDYIRRCTAAPMATTLDAAANSYSDTAAALANSYRYTAAAVSNSYGYTAALVANPYACTTAAVAAGAATPLLVAAGASALVPAAMSATGTVVAGVGTLHASAAAGGIAANLQVLAAGLWSVGAAVKGAAVAGGIAYFAKPARACGQGRGAEGETGRAGREREGTWSAKPARVSG